jgi:uncharacterized protein (TIGR02453 family)
MNGRLGQELFAFLRGLKRHNDRAWFLAHKAEYEHDVRDPFLAFIRAFAPRLAKISPHLVASAKPIGGSMFKIQRDVRFTKDKTPYHTRVAARFLHAKNPLGHGPGFYLHLEPGDISASAGIWRPDTEAAGAIRKAIAEHPGAWRAIVNAPAFRARVRFWGESLKRPPPGYRPDHPLIADLKRKDFVVYVEFTEREACAPGFLDEFVKYCAVMTPFNRFLASALGLPW